MTKLGIISRNAGLRLVTLPSGPFAGLPTLAVSLHTHRDLTFSLIHNKSPGRSQVFVTRLIQNVMPLQGFGEVVTEMHHAHMQWAEIWAQHLA